MKFKAFLTHDGVNLLDKRFLPALDKVGRICHVYLTRDHAMFLHNLLAGDGVQCVAQFGRDLLFRDYRISSQNEDRIAFSLDLSLLHRALRSALSILQSQGGGRGDPASDGGGPLQIQIKLLKKIPAGSQQPMPFLSFETKGYKSAVIHDVPISKPLSRADVMELQSALDNAQALPKTLVQVPDLSQLQNLVDHLKNVGDILSISITQYGDLHMQVSTGLVTVGSEFRKLRVLGDRGIVPKIAYHTRLFAVEPPDIMLSDEYFFLCSVDSPPGDQNLSAPLRTRVAIERGEAQSVQVNMKHLAKGLQCHLAKPDCAFYGIAPQGACLTVIFQFFIPGTRQMDKSISLHCRLPVLDTGSA